MVGHGVRGNDTKVALETAKTMFDNYQEATHLNRQPPVPYIDPPYLAAMATGDYATSIDTPDVGTNFWLGTPGGTSGSPKAAHPEFSPQSIQPDFLAPYLNPPNTPAVTANVLPFLGPLISIRQFQMLRDTACVMYALEAIPSNQTLLNNIPTSKRMVVYFRMRTDITNNTSYAVVSSTLLLDSWGNPILFAPANGMYAVSSTIPSAPWIGNGVVYTTGSRIWYNGVGWQKGGGYAPIATSSNVGLYYTWRDTAADTLPNTMVRPTDDPNQTSDPTWDPLHWVGYCSPDCKPFWVSAGADGDVSTGDDNVYSFQQ
jgi:hypothetical protein